jgi:metallo-beta-lactamase family protein
LGVTLKFLGGAGTVTGSKYLVTYRDTKILVDCGLFQGDRVWRERNWHGAPVDLGSISAVLLTHAHVDHVGILPRYSALGLRCPVYATTPTAALADLILRDSGRLQEEEAAYRGERGKSRHHPPLPLYTEIDAINALKLFKTVPFERRLEVLPGVFAEWRRMGHILGAASIRLEIGGRVINFSGDIGRYNAPILCDPQPVNFGDLLLIESTYGDRTHEAGDIEGELAAVIQRTAARRGAVLIPAFAVGRTQQLLFHLRALKEKGTISHDLPVIVDSPMARDATSLYVGHTAEYDAEAMQLLKRGKQPFVCAKLHFISDRFESMRLNSIREPMVIISASGMLTGGRVLHHLRHRVSDPANTIMFVGFQPPGSRGAWLKSNPETVRIFGEEVPRRAEIAEISALSAHGDRGELLRWCRESQAHSGGHSPGRFMVVHGEPEQAGNFSKTLTTEMGWIGGVAGYLDEIVV